jgi:hypothetical protein
MNPIFVVDGQDFIVKFFSPLTAAGTIGERGCCMRVWCASPLS